MPTFSQTSDVVGVEIHGGVGESDVVGVDFVWGSHSNKGSHLGGNLVLFGLFRA